MLTSNVTLHPDYTIGAVPPRLFGSFLEHMGRAVYGGVYEPGHPQADQDGMRQDVIELVRELGTTVVRYPGGNFVSGYDWQDGVGPHPQRRTRLDMAWRAVEPNAFGTDEFLTWCRLANTEPMLAVNLGTRGIAEACNLLEYTNHPGGTYFSDLRIAHGYPDPHNVRLWCLGNEMDGTWQIGHKTAEEYGRLAAETARAMRMIDPHLELVACGSSLASMPTFGYWESTVLEHAYDDVDFISLHAYFEQGTGDLGTFLASGTAMDRFIDGVIATVDHVKARRRSARTVKLSFDEWNVWGETGYTGHDQNWATAPRVTEKTYNTLDAIVLGGLLMSLLRHADRIGVACLAQLVNVIAPIRSEPGNRAWRQTTFYPLALTARHARGVVLDVRQHAPLYTCDHGDVPITDTIATLEPESGDLTVFALNRHQQEPVLLHIPLTALPAMRVVVHQMLNVPDPDRSNTEAAPHAVHPQPGTDSTVTDGVLSIPLPPLSWSVLTLTPTPTD